MRSTRVHATRPDDTGAVEIVFGTEREAIAYAKDRSTDWRVLAASVTRFTIGELGPGTPWPGSWTASSNRLALLDQAAGSIRLTDPGDAPALGLSSTSPLARRRSCAARRDHAPMIGARSTRGSSPQRWCASRRAGDWAGFAWWRRMSCSTPYPPAVRPCGVGVSGEFSLLVPGRCVVPQEARASSTGARARPRGVSR